MSKSLSSSPGISMVAKSFTSVADAFAPNTAVATAAMAASPWSRLVMIEHPPVCVAYLAASIAPWAFERAAERQENAGSPRQEQSGLPRSDPAQRDRCRKPGAHGGKAGDDQESGAKGLRDLGLNDRFSLGGGRLH